jgi:hypothetical protein
MWKGFIILDDYDILQAGDIHRFKLNNSEPSAHATLATIFL